jgi:hypothetical protein
VAEACGGVETVGRDIEVNWSDRRLRFEDVKTRTLHRTKSAAHEKAKRTARKGWPPPSDTSRKFLGSP